MNGDFSRLTFRRERHFSSVRMQQGRVQLDADWNEAEDIAAHLRETADGDLIGPCGVPVSGGGFRLFVPADSPTPRISAGRCYVQGVLCENEADVAIDAQPDLPGVGLPLEAGSYLAYLDVWQRHMTVLDDPTLRETALGGPDTATRLKTVWQVRLLRVPAGAGPVTCSSTPDVWTSLIAPSPARLEARTTPNPVELNDCLVPPGAGFRGLENQLYRVEIHQGGDLAEATFKWSRENGSVVTEWLGQDPTNPDRLTVSSIGRDAVLGFSPNQWVELVDEGRELRHEPGTIVQLSGASGQALTIDPGTAVPAGPVQRTAFPVRPRIRRWEGPLVQLNAAADGWHRLEHGVEVRFTGGSFRTGDYWLITARTANTIDGGTINWPQDGGSPRALAPFGIRHRFCRLAILERTDAGWRVVEDCRQLFPPVTELTSFFLLGGDGQEAMPGETLPQPLRVGVANGSFPVPGARVQFQVLDGGGTVSPADVTTDADGVASCTWMLGSADPSQAVEATLRNSAGGVRHLPIRFSANLSVARAVAYDPKACPDLTEQGVSTVQQALDALCAGGRGMRVVAVSVSGGNARRPLRNDEDLSVEELVRGIDIQCSHEPDPESLGAGHSPTCFVTLEVPYPLGLDERVLWGYPRDGAVPVVAFRPLILSGAVRAERRLIHWEPSPETSEWLRQRLFRVLGLETRVPGRLTLRGSHIWSGEGGRRLYLDGDTFGLPKNEGGPNDSNVVLPTGDGRRGGDLQMWFRLTVPPRVLPAGPLVFRVRTSPRLNTRAEGVTELVADLVLDCTGGSPTAPGTPVPLADIQVFLNTNLTSPLYGDFSDAVLLIDPPTDRPPTLNTTAMAATVPPVVTGVEGGVNYTDGSIPNVFLGRRTTLSGNTIPENGIRFDGVPLNPPGSGAFRTLRIANLRANANGRSASSTDDPTRIDASVSLFLSGQVAAVQAIVGSVGLGSLAALRDVRDGALSIDNGRISAPLGTPDSFNLRLEGESRRATSVAALNVRFQEQFATAFQNRAQSAGSFTPEGATLVPGSPALPPELGGARNGVRFEVRITGVPDGVAVLVTTRDTRPGTTPLPTSAPGLRAVLVGEDGSVPDTVPAGAAGSINGVPLHPVPKAGDTFRAFWEWVSPASDASLDFVNAVSFGLVFVPVAANVSPAIGARITILASLAPDGPRTASPVSVPVPRFAEAATEFSVRLVLP